MKLLYESFDKFMVRMPLLPNTNSDNTEQIKFESICSDPVFREQILISSKSLYDQMNMYLEYPEKMSEKKRRNFIQAITKYVLRRKSRTTPFGLFSSVGIGKFESQNLQFNKDSVYKKTRVDLEWLFGIIKNIEKERFRDLILYVNTAVYSKGDRACILYNTGKNISVESIRGTSAFKFIEQSAEQPIAFQCLLSDLKVKYGSVSDERLIVYLSQLIEKEYLISTLRPPQTIEDQFSYFLIKYEEILGENELLSDLKEINTMINEYEMAAIGEGEEIYLKLYQKMNQLNKTSSPLQIDTYNSTNEISLSTKYKNDINELVSMLTLLSKNGSTSFEHLDQYLEKFIDKYGVDREVSIMEMLDSNSGMGVPATYINPENDYYEAYQPRLNTDKNLKYYFLSKYFEAIQENEPIEITSDELEEFVDKNINSKEIPVSLEVYFQVKKRNNDIQLYLGPSGGSHGAGKTFGRFSYLSENIKDVIKELNKTEQRKRNQNIKTCELNYIPNNVRDGNVTRNLHYRERELSLFTSNSNEGQEKIKIDDILIGVDRQRFYARNKKNGEILVFLTTNMLNTTINHNAIRFLQEIALHGRRNWCDLPWNSYFSDFMHIPEIRFKNIILSLEQWVVSKYDLGYEKNMTYEVFKERFNMFHSKFRLPDHFYLVEFDNRIPIYIKSDESIRILYSECKRLELSQSKLVLQRLEEGEDPVINEEGERHCMEIVIPYFNREKEEDIVIPEKLSLGKCLMDREKFPFDDWLFIKLYVNSDRENELISFDCSEFCEGLKESTGINYFFMRYVDPKPHIRLRFKGEQELLLQHYPRILEWLKNLKQKDIISEAIIGTYDREVERYGGIKLIGLAENIFMSDSAVVEQLLRMERTKEIDIPDTYIGIISIIKYLEQFELTFNEMLEFINSYKRVISCNDYFREHKENIMALYKKCRVESSFIEEVDLRKTIGAIESRNDSVKKFREQYDFIKKDMKVSLFSIISSVIHLHCNRLFGVNKFKEDELMSLTAQTLNSLKYVLRIKENTDEKEKKAI